MKKLGRPKSKFKVQNQIISIDKKTHLDLREISENTGMTMKAVVKTLVDNYDKIIK